MEEQRHIEAILRDPRDKLPISQREAKEAQHEVDRFELNGGLLVRR